MLNKVTYKEKQDNVSKYGLNYYQIIIHTLFTIFAIYGLFHITNYIKISIFQFVFFILSMLGVTVGIHRYYNHRAFEFKNTISGFIAKIVMTYFAIQSGNGQIKIWSQAHRTHHRNSDIPNKYDPYDIHHGFWYAHILWLFNNAHTDHPEIKKSNISDLEQDSVLKFFDNTLMYTIFYIISAFIVPMYVGHQLFGLGLKELFFSCIIRQVITWHATFTINSLAHMTDINGDRPYDKNITPIRTILLSIVTCGEGYHNYHHSKCHDYRANIRTHSIKEPNLAALTIDIMDKIGVIKYKKINQ